MLTISARPTVAPATDANLVLPAAAQTDLQALPPSFPTYLDAELAWTGSDFSKTSDYVLVLDSTHHAEIKAAIEGYKCE